MKVLIFFTNNLLFFLLSTICFIPLHAQEPPLKWEMVDMGDYQSNKELKYHDYIYEPQIKSVQLYPQGGNRSNKQLNDPLIPVKTRFPLVLEFDEFGDEADYYEMKIIHCNYDWTPSQLTEMDFIVGFSTEKIDQFEFSINTNTPYIHFYAELPRVKHSGNYLLMVYREGDVSDLIITRRFMVYEERVSIPAKIQTVTGENFDKVHQIDFKVGYGDLPTSFPQKDFFVSLRQNNRWDNMISGLKPRFVKPNDFTLDYSYFDFENAFWAGNEYRQFSFQGSRGEGVHVKRVNQENNSWRVFLFKDYNRGDKTFNQQMNDLNGGYILQSYGRPDYAIEADYMEVVFKLETPKVEKGEVYVYGKFSDGHLHDEYKMYYVEEDQAYLGSAFLKQGIYDYMYTVLSPDGTRDDVLLEGSFRLAQNSYDILVYYRKPSGRGDRLVGVRRLNQ